MCVCRTRVLCAQAVARLVQDCPSNQLAACGSGVSHHHRRRNTGSAGLTGDADDDDIRPALFALLQVGTC